MLPHSTLGDTVWSSDAQKVSPSPLKHFLRWNLHTNSMEWKAAATLSLPENSRGGGFFHYVYIKRLLTSFPQYRDFEVLELLKGFPGSLNIFPSLLNKKNMKLVEFFSMHWSKESSGFYRNRHTLRMYVSTLYIIHLCKSRWFAEQCSGRICQLKRSFPAWWKIPLMQMTMPVLCTIYSHMYGEISLSKFRR